MRKLESRDFFLITRSHWFAEKMITESPFSSLDHATSFARQLWFKESRIQSWLDAFSGQSHLYRAIAHAPGPMMREMLHWDRKYRAKFGFEFVTSTETWFSQKILDEVKARYENTLVVELDIAAQEEFKNIEHGLERLWERLTFSQIQEASEAAGEVVPDSEEKEDIVPSGGSEEADSATQNVSMLSYDLNKTPKENDYPYSEMSPEEKKAWHLAMWATRYLNP
ncbi:uric acid degradation bifunctional protein TTL-like [Arachis stenosperma]|uniref:uric acid degradation bifunctional protein TTL-like n=1 Tax=Arachis stenosperma TaxID=217475 RepID=UPI0025AC9C4D|nr:uric acid degradation bifunctional protein TTL-like [Arachis stenosperma]